jgi:hypothetical protein
MKLRFTPDGNGQEWWWSLTRRGKSFGPDKPCKSLAGAKHSARAFLKEVGVHVGYCGCNKHALALIMANAKVVQ